MEVLEGTCSLWVEKSRRHFPDRKDASELESPPLANLDEQGDGVKTD